MESTVISKGVLGPVPGGQKRGSSSRCTASASPSPWKGASQMGNWGTHSRWPWDYPDWFWGRRGKEKQAEFWGMRGAQRAAASCWERTLRPQQGTAGQQSAPGQQREWPVQYFQEAGARPLSVSSLHSWFLWWGNWAPQQHILPARLFFTSLSEIFPTP